MDQQQIRCLLGGVAAGNIPVEEALLQLKTAPFTDLGFARLDNHRALRQGVAEVVYGAGKTPAQIIDISRSLRENGQRTVLITRLSPQAAQEAAGALTEFEYYETGRIGVVGGMPQPDGVGTIVVATGGTSDMPVAEEAALTAQALGNRVTRLYDVGVSGLHRLLSRMEDIMQARCVVAIAGMEGALASVIGGLADCPVIAVPTSVGYGAAFGGVAALLSMLNSCASGVSVVNIDNGFGAAYQASLINHLREGNE